MAWRQGADLKSARAKDDAYKETILPKNTPVLAMEMGATQPWYKYVGPNGKVLGIDRFGASAPGDQVVKEYGFTVENVISHVQALLKK